MNLKNIIDYLIVEQRALETTQTKPIVNAIKNRNKITFIYNGPRKPKKDSVLPGKRIKVEPFGIGLSKKGNLILRAYIDDITLSKKNNELSSKGSPKTHWRTFMIGRMRDIRVTDEIFNNRDDYKPDEDKSMSVKYNVKPDFDRVPPKPKTTKKPELKPKPEAKPKPEVKPVPKPEIKPVPKPEIKPEPKPQAKPEPKPETKPEPKPEVKPEPKPEVKPEPKPEVKPEPKPNTDTEEPKSDNLSEAIKRIKHLIYS